MTRTRDRVHRAPRPVGAYAQLVVAKLVALILPLGLDTLAVAAAIGAAGVSAQQRVRISILFTAFETGMPLIGLALGAPLGRTIGSTADYVAIAVLIAFGAYTLLSSESGDEEDGARIAQTRGLGSVVLGLSISLDELAIGFTLGLLRLPILLVLVLIAVQTVLVTQGGLRLGDRISSGLREGAERLAGIALLGLGAVLLAEQLLG